MSLARFAEKMSRGRTSDVYIYRHYQGGLECCACQLHEGASIQVFSDSGMLAHVRLHLRVGDNVPPRCLKDLRAGAKAEKIATQERVKKLFGKPKP